MTTVYTSVTVTGPDGEPVELELAADLSADGEVMGFNRVLYRVAHREQGADRIDLVFGTIPKWVMSQIDMRDLADDVLLKLQARERGWP